MSASSRLLILYPYSSLDTNPTMTFLLESLAQREVRVDVLAGQPEAFATPEAFLTSEPFGKTVSVVYLPFDFFFAPGALRRLPLRMVRKLIRSNHDSSPSLRFDPAIFKYARMREYSLVIGVDPHGIVLANALNEWVGKPLVYISFEILFRDDVDNRQDEELMLLERAACRKVLLAILQDDERRAVFCRETSLSPDRVLTIPVAPPPERIIKSDFLRRKLGIPRERRIVLYCGNLQSWASRDELAEMISYWPDEYCLVVHNRSKVQPTLQRFLDELTETGKIFVSSIPVARKEMSALVSSADFGLAPYKAVPGDLWTGKNMHHLGFASGKVSYYALCGLPILARPLPVFEREFARYKCGKIYRRLSETGDLLEEMSHDYENYRMESRRFYDERLNPVDGMQNFCDRLMDLASTGT